MIPQLLGAQLLENSLHRRPLVRNLTGAKKCNSYKLRCLGLVVLAVKIVVKQVIELAGMGAGSQVGDLGLSREDLEQDNPECIHVALFVEPTCRRVLGGQVTHGSAALQRREDDVVSKQFVQATAGESRAEMLIK